MSNNSDKNEKKSKKINNEMGDLRIAVDYVSSKMDLIEGKYKICNDFKSAIDYLNN